MHRITGIGRCFGSGPFLMKKTRFGPLDCHIFAQKFSESKKGRFTQNISFFKKKKLQEVIHWFLMNHFQQDVWSLHLADSLSLRQVTQPIPVKNCGSISNFNLEHDSCQVNLTSDPSFALSKDHSKPSPLTYMGVSQYWRHYRLFVCIFV